MKKIAIRLFLSLLAAASIARADTNSVTETFTGNPLTNGWQVFGDTSLFSWDSTNQVLDVTWDSSQSNSYFYVPLGTVLTKNDDFCFSFDLTLFQCGTGDSTGPLQLGVGFLNLTNAVDPSFERGAGISPNIAEFNYYPAGYFPGFPSPATATPGFVDCTSSAFAPDDLTPYEAQLPTNVLMHVVLAYTGFTQTAALNISTNGVPLAQFPALVINTNGNGGFTATNDYQVNMFSITSYSEAGQFPPYVASIYAQGTVANVNVTLPRVQNITGSFINGNWQTQFGTYTNWLYTLERSTNLTQWNPVTSINGNGMVVTLQDTNAPPAAAFYRVHASQP